jgi:hypothetical protein
MYFINLNDDPLDDRETSVADHAFFTLFRHVAASGSNPLSLHVSVEKCKVSSLVQACNRSPPKSAPGMFQ